MSTRMFRLLLVTAVLAFAAGSPVGAQSSEEPQTGVWWQLNSGGGLGLPPPPLVVDIPEGGLWLSSGPGGDQARSAVRIAAPARAVPESLSLQIHQDTSTPGLAIALCAVEGSWAPPESSPGPWADRAEPDCETFSTNGIVADDGETVDFALSGFDPGSSLDLVLTRVPDDPSTYVNATFTAPTAESLTVGSPVSSGGFVPPSTTTPPPVADSGGGAVFAPAPDFGSSSSFAPIPDAGVVDLPATADDGVGTGAETTPPASVPELAVAPAAFDEPSDAARWAAMVMLVVLLAWIGAILSRRMMGGAIEGPRFTLYRGAPPI